MDACPISLGNSWVRRWKDLKKPLESFLANSWQDVPVEVQYQRIPICRFAPKIPKPEVFRGILRIILGGKHFSDPSSIILTDSQLAVSLSWWNGCQDHEKALQEDLHQSESKCPRWFKVTFSSPSWRSLNPLKGSLNHPKKVTLNHQVQYSSITSMLWRLFPSASFAVSHTFDI